MVKVFDMTNLVFLEAAAQSDTADLLVENNASLIDFAVSEVDNLVEEQANYTAWNVGEFIEEGFEDTYVNVGDPVSSLVFEASSIFSNIIANEELTESEKVELIEACAHVVCMENALVGAAVGGLVSSIAGAGAAAVTKLFSKERKVWKDLVNREALARSQGANSSALKKIHDAKVKAKAEYVKVRNDSVKASAKASGVLGAIAGGVRGGDHGSSYGGMSSLDPAGWGSNSPLNVGNWTR